MRQKSFASITDMRLTVSVILVVTLVLAPSLAFSQESQEAPERFIREYRIGPRDLLEVNVYGEENFNNIRRPVNQFGRISLPLIGEVEVEGLTAGEVEKKLTELFIERDIFQNPSVTVLVVEHQSQRVAVLGAVASQGPYELIGRQKLLEIIAEAGGLTTYDGEITLIREQQDPLKIAISDLISGDDTYNIPLQPDDIVIVRPEEMVFIYVGGRVNSPGALQVPKSNIPTLYRAIIQAGGFAERAAKSRVIVKRMEAGGKEKVFEVDAKKIEKGKAKDIPLQPGDVIIVPETIF
ncbi:MAG: polysaccharide biosynthesis/export family protein [Candidatus Aminicenantales bacterium]